MLLPWLASILALLAEFTVSNQSQHLSRMMHTVDAAFEICIVSAVREGDSA